ncbi:cytochrome P450 [Amycolatopsis acidicola]|uniref:Cytochrome P450 n=1 Tax=Amycolatopsis acidicola TaxID=2596893 RepID=A0A5N0V279_9PSEU|nr:cytochrome P450 [Amycolatopsis acidicola]KAA9160476.1 cytochrome P450 [Amycolatopsis acidicola]
MTTQVTPPNQEISVLDPDTYMNGDPETFGLPLDQFDYLRKHDPVHLQRFDDPFYIDECWVLSRYHDLWEADRDPGLFASDRGGLNIWRVTPIDPHAGGLPAWSTMDGGTHKRNRGVVSKTFNPGSVRKLREKFAGYAKDVVDKALDKRVFNAVDDLGYRMPMEALGDILGLPAEDRETVFGWVDKFAAPVDPRITPSTDAAMEAIMSLWAYSHDLAERRLAEPGDDVVSLMVQAMAAGEMDQEELLGNITQLASGAAETTRAALSHGLHQMLLHPDQMQWARDRKDDLPATAIDEIVRIAVPFSHFVRRATRDVEMHGKTIREGDFVCLLFASGNFDPDGIPDPRKFDLSRSPNMHLSFARGPHTCLGKHVAGLEMKLLYEELFRRTKEIRLAGDVKYVRDAFTRGIYELPVELVPA